jgi:hypothetical protein
MELNCRRRGGLVRRWNGWWRHCWHWRLDGRVRFGMMSMAGRVMNPGLCLPVCRFSAAGRRRFGTRGGRCLACNGGTCIPAGCRRLCSEGECRGQKKQAAQSENPTACKGCGSRNWRTSYARPARSGRFGIQFSQYPWAGVGVKKHFCTRLTMFTRVGMWRCFHRLPDAIPSRQMAITDSLRKNTE